MQGTIALETALRGVETISSASATCAFAVASTRLLLPAERPEARREPVCLVAFFIVVVVVLAFHSNFKVVTHTLQLLLHNLLL